MTLFRYSNIVNEEAWWLYFCPWYGDFLMSPRYNDPVLLNTIYNSEYVITLDELPENLYEYDGEIPDINYGDLNNDGNINSTDYMILKKYILKVLERMNVPEKAADLNGDGSINSTDLTILKRFIMKAITNFPLHKSN